jgi:hypothetical protein
MESKPTFQFDWETTGITHHGSLVIFMFCTTDLSPFKTTVYFIRLFVGFCTCHSCRGAFLRLGNWDSSTRLVVATTGDPFSVAYGGDRIVGG